MKTLIDKIIKAENKKDALCQQLALKIQKHVDWTEVSVEYHPSDGVCALFDEICGVDDVTIGVKDLPKKRGKWTEKEVWLSSIGKGC